MSAPVRVEVPGDPPSVAWIGPGLLADADRYLVSPSGRFVLVSSRNVRPIAAGISELLGNRLLAASEIDDREESKTLANVESIADAFLSAGVRRDDALVAVGGGVVSDVAGFAAAILLRGIAWNVVPTTTGAIADASIGGKTGVDHSTGKNLLGAFHPPRAILADPASVATLPDREYRAGLVEAFKAAWIADGELASEAQARLPGILAREEEPLLELLTGSVRVKAAIAGSDPREGSARRLLNFGHTLGHAFEAAGGYRALRHGEAVAWGIAAALELSIRRCGLSSDAADAVRSVLARLGPFPEPERRPEVLAPYLSRDKKATARGIAGVLLEAPGRARIEEVIPADEWLEAARVARIPL